MSFVQVHLPCPCGKSSDSYSIDSNNWGHCFTCGKNFKDKDGEDKIETPDNNNYTFRYLAHRGISTKAFEKFNVSVRYLDETPVDVGFVYPNGAVKIRGFDKKEFRSQGNMKEAHLFGMDKFEKGGPVIIIVEGEYDTLAAWDMTNYPTVSIRSSSSAHKDCQAEYDFINSFDKIYIGVDNDTPGNKAAREIAGLFDFNKVYRIELTRHKDANAYLENGNVSEFLNSLKYAKKYTPDSIINTFPEVAKSLTEGGEERIGTYPFHELQDALHGLHKGEVVVIKGAEGLGKTEVFRAMEHHLLKTEDTSKLLIIHLEESRKTTIKGVATYEDSHPYIHLDSTDSNESILDAYQRAVKDESRLFIYDNYDIEDEAGLLDNVRFCVKSFGVNFVFLDHITWLATSTGADEDERRKLDRISQKIKLLAKELNFCFILISHTNDEGQTRGSRNITKVANTVIHLERDKTSIVEDIKTKTFFTVEKGRGGGSKTGPAGYAVFDTSSLMLKDQPIKVLED